MGLQNIGKGEISLPHPPVVQFTACSFTEASMRTVLEVPRQYFAISAEPDRASVLIAPLRKFEHPYKKIYSAHFGKTCDKIAHDCC